MLMTLIQKEMMPHILSIQFVALLRCFLMKSIIIGCIMFHFTFPTWAGKFVDSFNNME